MPSRTVICKGCGAAVRFENFTPVEVATSKEHVCPTLRLDEAQPDPSLRYAGQGPADALGEVLTYFGKSQPARERHDASAILRRLGERGWTLTRRS